ncbi:hypothetical protein [Corynebacterium qintianiae]|uniref:hypothetical protein n=1 Tax=Corynebacterium qintianiae TaxID=2709392 RepID=UPI0013EC1925|nr:hypothetical protein [Corynebacterium qintianiae]
MSTPTDYNSLDDTLAGQLAQAGFIAAMYAVPDFTRNSGARVIAWTGLVALNVAAVAAANAVDDDPRDDNLPEAGPAQTWAVLGGSVFLGVRAHAAVARWLRGRGVDKPHSLMGLLVGAGYMASKRLST